MHLTRRSIAPGSVRASPTLPASTSDRRGKPSPFSSSPSVTTGASCRFCSLRAPVRGILVRGPPGVVGVRQVVEDDARLQAEQLALAGEQRGLDRLVPPSEGVGGRVQGVAREVGGLQADEFPEGRVVAQPAQGLALGGGMQGAGEDLGQAQAHVARAQAALAGLPVEQAGGTGLAHVSVAQGRR